MVHTYSGARPIGLQDCTILSGRIAISRRNSNNTIRTVSGLEVDRKPSDVESKLKIEALAEKQNKILHRRLLGSLVGGLLNVTLGDDNIVNDPLNGTESGAQSNDTSGDGGGLLGGILGEDGLVDGVLGEDGVVNNLLNETLGDDGTVGGLLGEDGVVGGLLNATLGEDGVVNSLVGGDGIVDNLLNETSGGDGLLIGLVGEDGLVDDLLGGDGIVEGLLNATIGDDGLGDDLLGEDGLVDDLLGQDGLVNGLINATLGEDGLVNNLPDTVVDVIDETVGDNGLIDDVLDIVVVVANDTLSENEQIVDNVVNNTNTTLDDIVTNPASAPGKLIGYNGTDGFDEHEFLGDYPAPVYEPSGWQFADGYWWTVSCWVQAPYEPETHKPMAPAGGTSADCPKGLLLQWSRPPPLAVYMNEAFQSGVKLTVNHDSTAFQINNLDGMAYFIPHFAMYGCLEFDGIYCIPSIDSTDDFMKINQMVPPMRSDENVTEYQFMGHLRLMDGKYMVTSHVNFFDEDGNQVIMALGAFTTAEPEGMARWLSALFTVGLLAVVLIVFVMIYWFYRFRKERRKVKRLRPQTYPKNLPAPLLDVDALDEISTDEYISSERFMALEKLGDGAYGEVFKGALFREGTPILCAIKTLKEEHRVTLSDKFLAEASVMRQLRHQNVVRNIGVSGIAETERAEICILMEFLEKVYLQKYLIDNPQISAAELLSFSAQIARGCECIASHSLVHRDIAARNCLLGQMGSGGHFTVKISDFGLARVFGGEDDNYIMEGEGLMPIR
ncbi:serine/threonine protein kinase [Sphaeroforma arctica JP610]|uniref:Serine/threonine protein kinase n=1 Tax=Sphaeroforma arctica JP610 TaxID=667725 RepID=A0A0L0G8Q6_9EUKA|nr:serine/threonine protein kinase [Sphaeroforma arctica JP610]KNC85390.1 serine/threonine protein kinase [Sphaeroforma arctica JP610]|eukprot:XP_014159292.1 serine/threonine protein kinase [Sphaeroforma arctica JP610]